MTTISYEDGIKYADYILQNSNEYDGLVNAWRNECINYRATFSMLLKLKARYEKEVQL